MEGLGDEERGTTGEGGRGGEGERLTDSKGGRRLEASYTDILEGSICTSHKDQ